MTKLSLTVKNDDIKRGTTDVDMHGPFRAVQGELIKGNLFTSHKQNAERREDDLITYFMAVNIVVRGLAYLFHLSRLLAGDPIYPYCLCCPHPSCPSLEQLPFLQFPFPFLSSYAPSHSTWRLSPDIRAPFPLFPFAQPPHALRALQQNDMLHLITVYNVHVNILMKITIIIIMQYIADSAKVPLGIGN